MNTERHSGLTVETAREVCALPDPPGAREVLGPLLVRGERTVLGGHTGEGKSTFGLQMVRAAVHGDDFLGFEGSAKKALVIDAEQGLRTIKRRLRETRLDDCENVHCLRVPGGLRLDQDTDIADELGRLLTEGRYCAVFFDPLYKLHGGDSSAERDAVDLMCRLDAWREELDFALLLATHCRKPPPKTRLSLHDLFGSSAYLRGAEVVLAVERMGPGRSRLHFFKDRFGDLEPGSAWKLTFDRSDGFQRNHEDGATATTLDLVRNALTAEPSLTNQELRERTGRSERGVSGAVRELACVSEGERLKRWSLPAEASA